MYRTLFRPGSIRGDQYRPGGRTSITVYDLGTAATTFSTLGRHRRPRRLIGRELILPQRLQVGLYHIFSRSGAFERRLKFSELGSYFSEFGTGDCIGSKRHVASRMPQGILRRHRRVLVSFLGYPVRRRLTVWKILSGLYVSPAIDDDDSHPRASARPGLRI